jgi:large subunit ribosomal protein L23
MKMDPYAIVKHPLSTEKSIRLMESENKLVFVVSKKAKKQEIKKAIEEMFKAKVTSINTFVTQDGEKRAYVKFSMETPAVDIATQLGLI